MIDVSCKIIDGSLSIFLSTLEEEGSTSREIVLNSIKIIMDNGILNSTHPSIVSVIYDPLIWIQPDEKETHIFGSTSVPTVLMLWYIFGGSLVIF